MDILAQIRDVAVADTVAKGILVFKIRRENGHLVASVTCITLVIRWTGNPALVHVRNPATP